MWSTKKVACVIADRSQLPTARDDANGVVACRKQQPVNDLKFQISNSDHPEQLATPQSPFAADTIPTGVVTSDAVPVKGPSRRCNVAFQADRGL